MHDPLLVADIAQVVRSVAKLAPTVVIAPDAALVEDLGIDSLDLVRICMTLEDRFRLQIDVDEVPNFRCVSDLAAYVTHLRSAPAA